MKNNRMKDRSHTLYQLALFQSVAQGEYDGVSTVAEFKEQGDFGMGIFDAVNGELILVDGVVYQALEDGSVVIPDEDVLIPYGNCCFYTPDHLLSDLACKSVPELEAFLDQQVESFGKNRFYFVRIEGAFSEVTVRSERKQEEPYRMLNTALRTDQRSYHYTDIRGTMVGLYCPAYMQSMNAPGWHFHFISQDRKAGGHLTGAAMHRCTASMCAMDRLVVDIPQTKSFHSKDLGLDVMDAIREAEKGEF